MQNWELDFDWLKLCDKNHTSVYQSINSRIFLGRSQLSLPVLPAAPPSPPTSSHLPSPPTSGRHSSLPFPTLPPPIVARVYETGGRRRITATANPSRGGAAAPRRLTATEQQFGVVGLADNTAVTATAATAAVDH